MQTSLPSFTVLEGKHSFSLSTLAVHILCRYSFSSLGTFIPSLLKIFLMNLCFCINGYHDIMFFSSYLVLIYISLMINGDEYLFMCSLAILFLFYNMDTL